jgi:hypothetical protein
MVPTAALVVSAVIPSIEIVQMIWDDMGSGFAPGIGAGACCSDPSGNKNTLTPNSKNTDRTANATIIIALTFRLVMF